MKAYLDLESALQACLVLIRNAEWEGDSEEMRDIALDVRLIVEEGLKDLTDAKASE